LQIRLSVNPIDPFVIGHDSVTAKHYFESPISETAAFSGELLKSLQKRRIVGSSK
jgi:hypothetical protein